MNLTTELRGISDPIKVGFVGAGIFGSQVIHAAEATTGLETSVIADINIDRAKATFRDIGVPDSSVAEIDSTSDLDAAIDSGERAVTRDGTTVIEGDVDVIVDATGDPNVAAENGFNSVMAGKHFVNVSVEADTVCGPLLADIAEGNGVTYTLAYGDQPGKIIELCEWAGASGFEVVAAGRAAPKPDHYGTPDDALERYGRITSFGDELDPNPVMYNTFLDGTKEAVESVAAANALNLTIDTTGLHRLEVPFDECRTRFD